MKFKFGLRAKFTVLFLLFTIVMTVFIGWMTYYNYRNNVMKQIAESAVGYAKIAASELDSSKIVAYIDKTVEVLELGQEQTIEKQTLEELVMDNEYYGMQKELNNIKTQSGVLYLYAIAPISNEESIFIFDAYTPEEDPKKYDNLGYKQEYTDELYATAKKVMLSGEASNSLELTNSVYGRIVSAYAPILDSNGTAIAFVGVDYQVDDIEYNMKQFLYQIVIFTVAIIAVCFLLLLFIVHISIIHPIRALKKKFDEIAVGNLGVQVPIHGRDEISDISLGFNRMSKNIEGHVREMEAINNGYYKFVPSKIFQILHKSSVTDVVLGNQEEVEFTVSSMAIVGFERIIRTMSSEEMFDFINVVFNPCVSAVHEHNGVVEKFENAGLTAFYTENVENALISSISMCQKIQELNKVRGFNISEDINASIAITYGSVMIGVVGHKDRLATVTISEQTTMAEYLRAISPKYYVNILITASATNMIPKFNDNYNARFLGFLYISTSKRLEKLYDVFDGDNPEDRALKKQTKELFEQGVHLFGARNFYDARLAFVEVLKIFRKDCASREYLYLCNEYYQLENKEEIPIYIETY